MSPKNKGKFGQGKPKIEEEDEFVSGVSRVAEKLRPYAVRIAIVGGIVAIGLIIFSTYRWWHQRKDSRATELYAEAMEVSKREIVAEDAPDMVEPGEALPDRGVTYKSTGERNEAVLALLDKLSSEYGSTGVARQGRLIEGITLLDSGRYDDAIARLSSYAKSSAPLMLRLIAREGIGYALEAKAMAEESAEAREAGLRQALAAFEAIQVKDDGPRRDYALYHQGRMLATLEERDKAIEIFNKILAIEPPSLLADKANKRLALLKAVPADQ